MLKKTGKHLNGIDLIRPCRAWLSTVFVAFCIKVKIFIFNSRLKLRTTTNTIGVVSMTTGIRLVYTRQSKFSFCDLRADPVNRYFGRIPSIGLYPMNAHHLGDYYDCFEKKFTAFDAFKTHSDVILKIPLNNYDDCVVFSTDALRFLINLWQPLYIHTISFKSLVFFTFTTRHSGIVNFAIT